MSEAMWRAYTNETDSIRSFIDANGDPVTVEIGETKTFLARRENVSNENGVISVPRDGGYPVKNVYINPETKRMMVDYDDLSP